jgi:DNA (cytosine-5)-methyltransferase 1
MATKLRVLDLFAGIGMFSYGLEKTDLYKTVAFCEWDQSCQKVLNKNYPDNHVFGDIKNLTYLDGGVLHDDIEGDTIFSEVDIITGGFPCQDISYAGKGVGIEGERSGHWIHYKRLINEIKPKAAIIENVSALRTRGLDTVLQDLNEIGYDAEWHCIPASHLGAPHSRDRIWILAYSRSQRRSGLVTLDDLGEVGQWKWNGQEDLQQVYANPLGRSHSWPEPLLRRVDVSYPRRLDRLKQIGNTVYWPIVERLGYHVYKNII